MWMWMKCIVWVSKNRVSAAAQDWSFLWKVGRTNETIHVQKQSLGGCNVFVFVLLYKTDTPCCGNHSNTPGCLHAWQQTPRQRWSWRRTSCNSSSRFVDDHVLCYSPKRHRLSVWPRIHTWHCICQSRTSINTACPNCWLCWLCMAHIRGAATYIGSCRHRQALHRLDTDLHGVVCAPDTVHRARARNAPACTPRIHNDWRGHMTEILQ